MLVLYLRYSNKEVKEFRFCTMNDVLLKIKEEKQKGAIQYKIVEID